MDKLKNRMAAAAMAVIAIAFTTIAVAAGNSEPTLAYDRGGQAATKTEAVETYHGTAAAEVIEIAKLTATALPEAEQQAEPVETVEVEEASVPEADKPQYVYYDVPLEDGLQEWAQDLCAEYDFPHYDIVIALIARESSFRETVVSETNDYGYMQINRINHEWLREELGITDFADGEQNIHCGIFMLSRLYHKYEDIGLALMCYNCGERGASDLWEQGIYSTNYSRSIQQEAAELVLREDDAEKG